MTSFFLAGAFENVLVIKLEKRNTKKERWKRGVVWWFIGSSQGHQSREEGRRWFFATRKSGYGWRDFRDRFARRRGDISTEVSSKLPKGNLKLTMPMCTSG